MFWLATLRFSACAAQGLSSQSHTTCAKECRAHQYATQLLEHIAAIENVPPNAEMLGEVELLIRATELIQDELSKLDASLRLSLEIPRRPPPEAVSLQRQTSRKPRFTNRGSNTELRRVSDSVARRLLDRGVPVDEVAGRLMRPVKEVRLLTEALACTSHTSSAAPAGLTAITIERRSVLLGSCRGD